MPNAFKFFKSVSARAISSATKPALFGKAATKFQPKTISIVGGGNVVKPMLKRWSEEKYPMYRITVSTRGSKTASKLQQIYGVLPAQDNREGVSRAANDNGIVLFALKAQNTLGAAEEVAHILQSVEPGSRPLIISVSSTKLGPLTTALGGNLSVIRAMPNTPSQIGEGVTALFANEHTTQAEREFAEALFSPLGKVCWVEREEQMDAMTVLTGCGPAYVFRLIEAMAEATVNLKQGISQEQAMEMAIQVVCGAGLMARGSDIPVGKLRQDITTPNGITFSVLQRFNRNDEFSTMFNEGFDAGVKRCRELGGAASNPAPSVGLFQTPTLKADKAAEQAPISVAGAGSPTPGC